jgi:hypothetical protein
MLCLLAHGALTACSGGEDAPTPVVVLPGDDAELARVGESRISQYDLDRALVTSLGPLADTVDEETRRDVLDSLITSRAISAARERELTPEQRAALEREVAAHREQLLVRQYLAQHAPAEAPSDADVQAYYDAHRDRSGAHAVPRYEMLLSTRPLTDEERGDVVARLNAVGATGNWTALATELSARGLPIARREGDADDAFLHARLRQMLSNLTDGTASPLTIVEGRAFVLRKTGESPGVERPIAEVREEIRRALGPRSTRDSMRAVRDDVLRDVRVVYTRNRDSAESE